MAWAATQVSVRSGAETTPVATSVTDEPTCGRPKWEIVMDEIHPISDGRPLSFFMARRLT
jgi:hypothetical protein